MSDDPNELHNSYRVENPTMSEAEKRKVELEDALRRWIWHARRHWERYEREQSEIYRDSCALLQGPASSELEAGLRLNEIYREMQAKKMNQPTREELPFQQVVFEHVVGDHWRAFDCMSGREK